MNADAKVQQPFADYVAGLEPGDDLKVFPCRENEKRPATTNGYKDASADPVQLTAWAKAMPGANVGHCPDDSGHLVLDVDPKNGGEESLAALIAERGPLPATFTVSTPSGGRHYWFQGSAPSSAGKIGPGLDVRGRGGYVLLPGSRTAVGEYITIVDAPAAVAPAWLMEKANAPAPPPPQSAPEGFKVDQPWNVERAVQHAKTCEPAVEGNAGDSRTLQVAYDLRDLGCSQTQTLGILSEHFNPRCEPPWIEDELAVKVENAFKYAQNEPGSHAVAAPAETYAHITPPPPDAPSLPNGPVPFSTVLTRVVQPVKEVIAGLVEKGTVTTFSGTGGTHKSRLSVQWGLSIDVGVPVFGRSVERATFNYVSYEDHPDEVARRVQTIAPQLKLPSDSTGQFWDMTGKDAPLAIIKEDGTYELKPFWHTLHGHLRATPGHKFVVLDSCYNALRFAGNAKINETSVMVGIGLLQRLCDETDSTILVLWHPSQAGQERGDASGWSVAWHNAPRARLSISPVKDTEDAFELRVEKRNHGAKGQPITLYWTNGALLPRAETDAANQNARLMDVSVRVAVLAAEQGAPIQKQRRLNTWMLEEIETAVGYRPTQRDVKEVLASAMRAGRLRYVTGTQKRTAGYYPSDAERAAELANAAKRQAGKGGSDA